MHHSYELKQCKRHGISLIEVPYWWDGSKSSLMASIHQIRPDLVPSIDTEISREFTPIPPSPPEYISTHNIHLEPFATSSLQTWDDAKDPVGWFVVILYH